MKTAVYIVESPMQLMTALEAKDYFKPVNNYLIIRYNCKNHNDEQIDSILAYGRYDKVHSVKIKEGNRFAYIKLLFIFLLLAFYRPDTLFIGDYKANFMKVLYKRFPRNKTIFLDDGAQSSYIYYEDPQANMFSYFKFENPLESKRLYIHNEFSYFKRIMKKDKKTINENSVFFYWGSTFGKQDD